jgi:hypothetical protein
MVNFSGELWKGLILQRWTSFDGEVLKHERDGELAYCYVVDIDKYREKHRLLLNALRHHYACAHWR